MPAATSHEDIYHQTTSTGLFSYDSNEDYHYYFGDPQQILPAAAAAESRQHHHHHQQQLQHHNHNQNQQEFNHKRNQSSKKNRDLYLTSAQLFNSRKSRRSSLDEVEGFGQDIRPIMLMCDNLSTSSTPSDFHLIANTANTNTNDDAYAGSNNIAPQQQYQQQQHTATNHYLTIEELKLVRNSCWLCGCNWQEDHVSLDCPECGGYALNRPCPSCDGKCNQIWRRNISGTHDHHKALWVGQCNYLGLSNNINSSSSAGSTTSGNKTANDKETVNSMLLSNGPAGKQQTSANGLLMPPPAIASSCCSSQPSSASSSSDEESDDQHPHQNQNQHLHQHQHQHHRHRQHIVIDKPGDGVA